MHRKSATQKVKRKRGRPPKKKRISRNELPALTEATPTPQIAQFQETIRIDAPETSCFMLCNGKPVKNIKELADVLEELEDQVFNYHVTPEKNDFATWIKDVFKDVQLAEKLADVKDKKHMQLVLYKHITHKLW